MTIDDAQLKEILLGGSYVTEEDLVNAEEYVNQKKGTLTDYLLAEGILNKDLLGQAIAEAFNVPYADLNTNVPTREQVLRIPEEIARQYRVVLYSEDDEQAAITTDTLSTPGLLEALQPHFGGKGITITYSLPEDIDAAFVHYRKPLDTRITKILEGTEPAALGLLDAILEDAIAYRASDIHFEPQEKELVVRFRIDGVLQEAGRFPKQYYENVLNRIKVLSRLRIDEHFAAQDGSLRWTGKTHPADMRVSVAPTLDGEKVTIRVLAQYVRGLRLQEIGMDAENQALLEKAADKPFGMIVIAGPTGSGKTTTLYALLRLLNQPDVNITTIEDPVEYKVAGINQIQVNQQTNLTFAKGLRSIVRQDPDIILVGEIRDKETAEISVNAALTGHLLLSTFHANDAASAIPRMLDMGVEPFLLSSTLELIAAQRLVRRLCDTCRYSVAVKKKDLMQFGPAVAKYFPEKNLTLYQSKGCEACNNTGFLGRIAIFEFIPLSEELKLLVVKQPTAQQIWQKAREDGAKTMFEDGVNKVKRGVTTLDELVRVSEPPRF